MNTVLNQTHSVSRIEQYKNDNGNMRLDKRRRQKRKIVPKT